MSEDACQLNGGLRYFLVFSNFGMIPLLIFTWVLEHIYFFNPKRRKMWPEFVPCFVMMLTSGVYHIVDSGLAKDNFGLHWKTLLLMDFGMSNLTIAVVLMFLADFTLTMKTIGLFLSFYVIILEEIDTEGRTWEAMYVSAVIWALIVIIGCIRMWKVNSFSYIWTYVGDFEATYHALGYVFLILALAGNRIAGGDNWYCILHSSWHFGVMISAFSFLKSNDKSKLAPMKRITLKDVFVKILFCLPQKGEKEKTSSV